MMLAIVLAVTLFSANQDGIELTVDAETKVVDPAKSMFVTVTTKAKGAVNAEIPDLRDRVVGFRSPRTTRKSR